MLSCVIPAYNEPHLQRTIDSLLLNAEGDIEIIVVLDGYWPEPSLKVNQKVHLLHLGKNKGMRAAINAGIALSKGEFILKSDAHCMFGKGYDKILLENAESNSVYIPRRFKLDREKWEILPNRPIDYEKLIIHETYHKFHGEEWKTRAIKRKDILIDETMSFQGSCCMMSRKHWDSVIGELDENTYGPFLQEPVEVGMKTWQSGGKLLVKKNTWYAHKHRDIKRSHHIKEAEANIIYARVLDIWKDEYEKLKLRFGI